MSIKEINEAIKNVDANLVSDGYHTFGELYEHRIANFMALCRLIYNYEPYEKVPVWMSAKHHDGSGYEGWFIMGIHTDYGSQISYHLPLSKWDECCTFARLLPTAPEWDGHTSEDVIWRLSNIHLLLR